LTLEKKKKRRLKAPFFLKCMKFLKIWLEIYMKSEKREIDIEELRGDIVLTNGKSYRIIFERNREIRLILPKD